MKKEIKNRVLEEADHILKSNITIRELAKNMHLSKSTIHKDLQERLFEIDPTCYQKVRRIFQEHIAIRHIHGGLSTKQKYAKNRNRNEAIVE